MMKEATPTLLIELNIDCPHCGYFFDLRTDTHLDDEYELLDMAIPSGGLCWSVEHEKFECEVDCPKCGKTFLAKGVDW